MWLCMKVFGQFSGPFLRYILIASCIVLALGVFSIVSGRNITVREAQFAGPGTVKPFHIHVFEKAIVAAYDEIVQADVEFFADAAIVPQKVFTRISESGEPNENYMLQSTTYTLKLPRERRAQIVPLHIKRRGMLSDGLQVSDGKGTRLSTVHLDEALVFYAALFRRLAQLAGQAVLASYKAEHEVHVVTLLSQHTHPGAAQIANVSNELSALAVNADDQRQVLLLILLVRFLLQNDPILVRISPQPRDDDKSKVSNDSDYPIPATSRYTVTEKLAVLREKPARADDALDRVRVWMRPLALVALGLKDNVLFFPLGNASRAQSYHFQTEGPDDAYLVTQKLNGIPSTLLYQLRAIGGQSFSHVYIRNAPAMDHPFYQGRYYDVPPGAIGVAVLAAFSSLFAMTILGVQHLNWNPVPGGTITASLLLGLPAILVAYLGIGRTGTFLMGSVSARLVSVVSLVLSLAAISVTALKPRESPYSPERMWIDIGEFSTALAVWATILTAQGVALLFALGVWLYRTAVYFGVTRERPQRRDAMPEPTS